MSGKSKPCPRCGGDRCYTDSMDRLLDEPPAPDIAALVAELREKMAKATALPWHVVGRETDNGVIHGPYSSSPSSCVVEEHWVYGIYSQGFDEERTADIAHFCDHETKSYPYGNVRPAHKCPNAEFIVAATNAIPVLCQAWEEATAKLEIETGLVNSLKDADSNCLKDCESRLAAAEKRERVLTMQLDALERARPLCPDHRDKQRGKDCIECHAEKRVKELESLVVQLQGERPYGCQ